MKGRVKGVGKIQPSFFIFLSSCECTDHLEIPQPFLKYMKNELSARATFKLKVNSERSWRIRVRETPRGLDFEDGWEEFSKDNSLEGNEVLIVTYEGMMHFTIRIFNKGGVQRSDSRNTRSFRSPNTANTVKRPPCRPRITPVRSTKRLRQAQVNYCEDDSDAVTILTSSESNELNGLRREEDRKDKAWTPAKHESSHSMLNKKHKRHDEQEAETENEDKEQGSEDGNCNSGEHESDDGENMDGNEERRSGNNAGNIYEQSLMVEVNELLDELEVKDKQIMDLKRDLRYYQKMELVLADTRDENSLLVKANDELAKEKELLQHEIEQLRQ